MTTSAGKDARVPPQGAGALSGIVKWSLPAALALLVTGVILVVLGTQIAPLFLPGTWLILAGLLAFLVFGIIVALRAPAST
jgi:hypothetical protein